jgi:uncharacterized protein YcbK (DUF882 family)
VRAALVIALVALAAPAAAEETALPAPPAPSKKDARWNEKQSPGKPLRKVDRKKLVGKPAGKVISLYNTWTHEWVAVDAKAKALPEELTDRLLRCHFTNEPTDMDNRLSGVVLEAARHFGATRVNIVSGFRAPKYNLMLRKKGRRVAKDSEHTRGHAVDFWMPGVSVDALYSWAMSHQVGGVGKYVSDGFVHMDVGKKRTWVDP